METCFLLGRDGSSRVARLQLLPQCPNLQSSFTLILGENLRPSTNNLLLWNICSLVQVTSSACFWFSTSNSLIRWSFRLLNQTLKKCVSARKRSVSVLLVVCKLHPHSLENGQKPHLSRASSPLLKSSIPLSRNLINCANIWFYSQQLTLRCRTLANNVGS